jgi:hypothetical protein
MNGRGGRKVGRRLEASVADRSFGVACPEGVQKYLIAADIAEYIWWARYDARNKYPLQSIIGIRPVVDTLGSSHLPPRSPRALYVQVPEAPI